MSVEQPALTIPFRLRGHDGQVIVTYGINHDPASWGYDLLSLPFDAVAVARGFPICSACVAFGGRGYAAYFGWIQIVNITNDRTGEHELIVDHPPMFGDAPDPFLTFGPYPMLFDAPSMDAPGEDYTWSADSFLAYGQDEVMSPVVGATLGFRWGYRLRLGRSEASPIEPLMAPAWDGHLPVLRERFPAWTFLEGFGDDKGS